MAARPDAPTLRLYTLTTSAWVTTRHRAGGSWRRMRHDDRGEGVVSAALVVLIMAAIAALMWGAFNTMWNDVKTRTEDKVSEVGT